MNVDEIRETFIRFYTEREHLRIPSASLVPHGDPTLLFTSAGHGAVQAVLHGAGRAARAAHGTVQKCFRTTDIDEVGDCSHLTFFEMLGNFSVGDYFKQEAIGWAWELLTEQFKLPKDKLWVSIFETDEEAHDLWRDIGLPEERIKRYARKEQLLVLAAMWVRAGRTARSSSTAGLARDVRVLRCRHLQAEPGAGLRPLHEVWNLVFMTLYRHEDGTRTELPRKNIDTGSGLERMACSSRARTPSTRPTSSAEIIERIEVLTGKPYGET